MTVKNKTALQQLVFVATEVGCNYERKYKIYVEEFAKMGQ